MRRRISIRGCVRPSVGPYVRPVLFSKVKSTHTRRILCRVSGIVLRPKPSLSFLPPSPGLSHEGGLRRIRRQHLSTQPSFRYHDVKKQRNTHTKLSLSTSEYFMTSTRLQQISIAKNSVYEMNRLPVEKEPPVLNGLKMKCFPLGLTGHIVKDKPRQFLCFFNWKWITR